MYQSHHVIVNPKKELQQALDFINRNAFSIKTNIFSSFLNTIRLCLDQYDNSSLIYSLDNSLENLIDSLIIFDKLPNISTSEYSELKILLHKFKLMFTMQQFLSNIKYLLDDKKIMITQEFANTLDEFIKKSFLLQDFAEHFATFEQNFIARGKLTPLFSDYRHLMTTKTDLLLLTYKPEVFFVYRQFVQFLDELREPNKAVTSAQDVNHFGNLIKAYCHPNWEVDTNIANFFTSDDLKNLDAIKQRYGKPEIITKLTTDFLKLLEACIGDFKKKMIANLSKDVKPYIHKIFSNRMRSRFHEETMLRCTPQTMTSENGLDIFPVQKIANTVYQSALKFFNWQSGINTAPDTKRQVHHREAAKR